MYLFIFVKYIGQYMGSVDMWPTPTTWEVSA